MVALTTLLLASLPLATLANDSPWAAHRKRQHHNVGRMQTRATKYTLQEKYQGQSFFE